MTNLKKNFLYTLSSLDLNHVFNLTVSFNEKPILKCRQVQQENLRKLIQGNKPDFQHYEKGIYNFSSYL